MPPALKTTESLDLLEQLLNSGCRVRFRVLGRSMQPWIRDGDVLTFVPRSEVARLLPGAVVFYRNADGRRLCHRLLDAGDRDPARRLAIRGDLQSGRPDRVSCDAVSGVAILLERGTLKRRLDTAWPRWRGRLWAASQSIRAAWGIRLGRWRRALAFRRRPGDQVL